MSKYVKTEGISYGSLYKLLMIGSMVFWSIFGLCAGLASYFGYHTVTVNGEHVMGLYGLIAGIVIGPILSIIFTTVYWVLLSFGLWLYTRFKTIHLQCKMTDDE
jgi:phage shock protein PspC (stress-responsive transcriptional regulator)